MALFERLVQKTAQNNDPPAAVMRRVKMLPDSELISWIDTTVISAGRNSSKGSRSERIEDQAAYLHEAESDAWALLAMLGELRERRGL